MTIVVSCGIQEDWCSFAQRRLNSMGIRDPLPATRSGMTSLELTQKMGSVAGRLDLEPGESAVPQLGRAWQIAAADLVIANAENEVWGWANTLNLNFLDFWRDFDPESRFLLIYGSPADYIASSIQNSSDTISDIDRKLEHWTAYHSDMLGFFQRNAGTSMLVNIHNFEGTARKLGSLFSDRLGLRSPRLNKSESLETSPLLAIIAERLLAENESEAELFSELENSADLSAQSASYSARSLSEQALEELSTSKVALEEKHKEAEGLVTQVEALDRQLAQQQVKIGLLEEGSELHESENTELLRRQLDQTREELHHYYRQFFELKSRVGEANNTGHTSEAAGPETGSPQVPDLLSIDMRSYINGTGWHHAEEQGRWAGASLTSTIQTPALASGKYKIEVTIVDAMSLDILRNTKLSFNGTPLNSSLKILSNMGGRLAPLRRLKAHINATEKPFPAIISAFVDRTQLKSGQANILAIESPRTIQPDAEGGLDDRSLSSCIRTVTVNRVA
ncbi:MAG: hypothetical protein ACX94B_00295 [Henriciella sp.]